MHIILANGYGAYYSTGAVISTPLSESIILLGAISAAESTTRTHNPHPHYEHRGIVMTKEKRQKNYDKCVMNNECLRYVVRNGVAVDSFKKGWKGPACRG